MCTVLRRHTLERLNIQKWLSSGSETHERYSRHVCSRVCWPAQPFYNYHILRMFSTKCVQRVSSAEARVTWVAKFTNTFSFMHFAYLAPSVRGERNASICAAPEAAEANVRRPGKHYYRWSTATPFVLHAVAFTTQSEKFVPQNKFKEGTARVFLILFLMSSFSLPPSLSLSFSL